MHVSLSTQNMAIGQLSSHLSKPAVQSPALTQNTLNDFGPYNGLTIAWVVEHSSEDIKDNLQRMAQLAAQACSPCDAPSRSLLEREYHALGKEIDNIAQRANYDNHALLNGTEKSIDIHINQQKQPLPLFDGTLAGLGIAQQQLSTPQEAEQATVQLKHALKHLSEQLGLLNESKQAISHYTSGLSLKA